MTENKEHQAVIIRSSFDQHDPAWTPGWSVFKNKLINLPWVAMICKLANC